MGANVSELPRQEGMPLDHPSSMLDSRSHRSCASWVTCASHDSVFRCAATMQRLALEAVEKAAFDAMEKARQETENDRMEWEEKLTWDALELRDRNLKRLVSDYRPNHGPSSHAGNRRRC